MNLKECMELVGMLNKVSLVIQTDKDLNEDEVYQNEERFEVIQIIARNSNHLEIYVKY